MFLRLFERKKIDDKSNLETIDEIKLLLNQFNQKIELRFNEISSQIKEVELGIQSLEKKLLTKDLKDKQAFGMLHYKIEEKRKPEL